MRNKIKKRGSWLAGKKGTWWFSALLNLALLALLLLILQPCYETNDDTTIYELTAGSKGVYDSHTIFIHILVGKFLKLLYTAAPGLQWYTLLQYAVLLCSFTAISYVLLNRLRTGAAIAVFGTLYPYFGYEGYMVIQFSKTAGIAVCAGILLMFHGLERLARALGGGRREEASLPKDRPGACRGMVLLGILLALVGGMYRYKEFLLCAALMSGIGVYTLFTLNWKKAVLRVLAAYLGSFALLFLAFFGLHLYDKWAYASQEDWGGYIEFNDARSNLLDYGFPDYKENQELYEQLGVSNDDLKLYVSGNYADPDLFDRELIETLLARTEDPAVDREFLKNYLDTFPVGFLKISVFTCFLLICCYWLFWGRKGRWEILGLIYEAALMALAYGYLFYLGRYLVSRVETAMWLAAALLVIWLLDERREYFSRRTALAFCACALAFCMNQWQSGFRADQGDYNAMLERNRELLENVGRDEDHLYLAKLGTLTTFLAYGPFDVIPFGSADNVCKLGGWEYGDPVNDSVLERYGVSNPYRDMINNPQVIVVDANVKNTQKYLKAHYDEKVKYYEVKQINNQHFYVFRSQPLVVDTQESQPADETVVNTCELSWGEEELKIQGLLYREGTDSFSQRVYVKVTDTQEDTVTFYEGMTYAGEDRTDLYHGQYGGCLCKVSLKNSELSRETLDSGRCQLELILDTADGMYAITY